MDVLWSPWRHDYVTGSGAPACVFCQILENSASDEENFILERAEFNFVILNVYPYATAHLLIVPYKHLSDLNEGDKAATDELMDLVKRCQTALMSAYHPEGFNLGMNLGKSAGAGVAGHYHMHMLPRWTGDVNFMTAIGQTRTMPETLRATYDKLKGKI